MGLIQTIKDFRKWRKEKYKEAFLEVVRKIAEQDYPKGDGEDLHLAYFMGLLEGIEHRKEILKKVKI